MKYTQINYPEKLCRNLCKIIQLILKKIIQDFISKKLKTSPAFDGGGGGEGGIRSLGGWQRSGEQAIDSIREEKKPKL